MAAILTLRPDQLAEIDRFSLVNETDPRYTVEIFEEPIPGHTYGAGMDTALGIEGKDRDVLQIFDRDTWPIRQVCEVIGHLGERFHKVVYADDAVWGPGLSGGGTGRDGPGDAPDAAR